MREFTFYVHVLVLNGDKTTKKIVIIFVLINCAILSMPQDDPAFAVQNTIYFRGFSKPHKNMQDAVLDAFHNAKLQISTFIYEAIEENHLETFKYTNDKGKTIEELNIINAVYSGYTKNILSGITWERISNTTKHPDGSIEVELLVPVTRDTIDRIRRDFKQQIENLSQYYTHEITKHGKTLEALRAYRSIAAALDPVQRVLVEYISPEGRVNLYNYVNAQIPLLTADLYTVRAEFGGVFKFSDSEQMVIVGALQQGLQNHGVSLRLLSQPQDMEPHFRFVITAESSAIESYGRELIRWKVPGLSIRLLFDNKDLLPPEYFAGTAFTREYLIAQTASAIQENAFFFQKIREKL